MTNEAIIYTELAPWFHLLTAPEEYEEEAGICRQHLVAACARPPQHVLELGSGGGNNASHMKAHFKMTLVDLSDGMLELSRTINPEIEHVQGDMRTVRLGGQFDAVFVHDAIVYMTTEDDLRAAIATAYVHCAPGGAALFAPDYIRETFRPGTDHGGHDADGRSMRYLEWVRDPDPNDDTYEVDYALILMEDGRPTRVAHDHHVEGLFSRGVWLRLLTEAGFEPREIPFEHSEVPEGAVLFVGVKR